MADIVNKSFNCEACKIIIPTYKRLRSHMKKESHKSNIIIQYPQTLVYNMVDTSVISTGRIDMNKINEYIKVIPKIEKKKKEKKEKKDKKEEIVILDKELYKKEYLDMDYNEMKLLINHFILYIKFKGKDPNYFFDYKYYKDDDSTDNIIDTYTEISQIILDNDFNL
jgi:hypothetical protein